MVCVRIANRFLVPPLPRRPDLRQTCPIFHVPLVIPIPLRARRLPGSVATVTMVHSGRDRRRPQNCFAKCPCVSPQELPSRFELLPDPERHLFSNLSYKNGRGALAAQVPPLG